MSQIVKGILVACILAMFSIGSYAHATKVVVIPLYGDDDTPFAPLAAPSPANDDYTIDTDTVIDNITSREWQRAHGPVANWNDALDYCVGLTLNNKDDWRLPSVSELMSIVKYDGGIPSINRLAFPSTQSSSFWTATRSASDKAERIDFSSGFVWERTVTDTLYVRCVRSNRANGLALKDNNNGTVKDLATGLTWQQNIDNDTKTWVEAVSYCTDLVLGSKSDWRLPNIKELASILDFRANRHVFGSNSNSYWSSTSDNTRAYDVAFRDVWRRDKTQEWYVRCVS